MSDKNALMAYLAVLCVRNGGKLFIPTSVMCALDLSKGELSVQYDAEEEGLVIKYKQ